MIKIILITLLMIILFTLFCCLKVSSNISRLEEKNKK